MVHYNNELLGEVELTINSAGKHQMLMSSIVNVIRMAVQCTTGHDGDGFKIVPLLEFLDAILPGEYQLEDGIDIEEDWFKKSKSRSI